MSKGSPDKVKKTFGSLEGVGPGREKHGGAVYVWAGCKMLRAYLAEDLGIGVGGHQNGEASVIAAAGGGADALGYLQLYHAHKTLGQVQFGHEPRDDGGGHVVGQVPCDPGLFVGV